MDRAVDEDTAAVILEPIQGEGGVIIPSPEYLPAVRRVCSERGALLILDEVQTGLGRTGKMFACEHYGVVPDIMVLAKALGGGILPLGAFISTEEIWSVFEENPLLHSSTFGGNPLACVAGIETLQVLKEEDIPRQAEEKGKYVLGRLSEFQREFPELICEVRGVGLLIGMEFFEDDMASLFAMEMAGRGVLVVYTLNNRKVIRLEPPLTISFEELDAVLGACYEALQGVQKLVKEVGGW
jgi:putrescine aminotransferase